MSIQDASIEDITGIIRCYEEAWNSLRGLIPNEWIKFELDKIEKGIFEESLIQDITNPDHILLVTKDKSEVVGMIQGGVNTNSGLSWLRFIGVKPKSRGKGFGKALVSSFIGKSIEKNADKISLQTAPSLKHAIKIYVDQDFVPEGLFRKHLWGQDIIQYSKFV